MRYLSVLFLCIASAIVTDIQAQEITEFVGPWNKQYFQDDTPITLRDAKSLILHHEPSAELWKKWQKKSVVTTIAAVGTLGFAIWANANDNSDRSTTVPIIASIASFGVAIGYGTSAFNDRKNAILTYNSQFDDRSAYLGPSNNGFGLTISL